MPQIPAFCDSCGAVFASGYVVENSTNIQFSGCKAGPCPACGGTGHVPDGVFNVIGATIEVLSAPQRTIQELGRLAEIIREARAKQQSREQVAQRVKKEVPAFSGVLELLPHNRGELYGFLAVILAAIPLLRGCAPQDRPNVTITQIVNQVYNVTPPANKPTLAPPKVGRNDPCPCGSGKKFKQCCGKPK